MTTDILVIGGGIIGLSLAIELKLRGATVTLLSRDFQQAATHAAGGMLAPQAERIPPGAMLDLCLRSRSMYPEWIRKIEDLSGLSAGYWPCGILAPVYDADTDKVFNSDEHPAHWLNRDAIRQYQPGLGEDVVGGWWLPQDGEVDSRALGRALWMAAQELGIDARDGVTVKAIQQQGGRVTGVLTDNGTFNAQQYALAAGAWSNQLLPIPVRPHKGQMLSVRAVDNHNELPLGRVLYGPSTYIVPRQTGQIVIGATSEDVGFTPGNTPAGIKALVDRAIRLYPRLRDYPIEEFWWGLRPATPDDLPILGPSWCDNLALATGHYRNGILLAPVTATLLADWIERRDADPLLSHFHLSRFQSNSAPNSQSTVFATPTSNGFKPSDNLPSDRPLTIAGREFRSRLMTGSGKYGNIEQMQQSIAECGSQIVTVAVRRVKNNAPGHEGLAEALDWQQLWMLPNTAGCKTAEEAIRVARLGREMAKLLGQEDNNFVKLEVVPEPKHLLPDPIGTLHAAEQLVKEGFAVLPYINADPMLAKRLEEVGCATVMPLGSPIGSGQGLKTEANIEIIIESAGVPVVVDAGIGTPSEAAQAMEMGADAVLINSAIAHAKHPVAMAKAMGMAVEAGRLAFLAGRMAMQGARASSPLTGTIA